MTPGGGTAHCCCSAARGTVSRYASHLADAFLVSRACRAACPMDVDVFDDSRSRRNGTECILCLECAKVCKKGALKL